MTFKFNECLQLHHKSANTYLLLLFFKFRINGFFLLSLYRLNVDVFSNARDLLYRFVRMETWELIFDSTFTDFLRQPCFKALLTFFDIYSHGLFNQ